MTTAEGDGVTGTAPLSVDGDGREVGLAVGAA